MSGPSRQSIYAGRGPSLMQGPGTKSAGLTAFPFEIFMSPILDLSKTYADIELLPARPGYIPRQLNGYWLIIAVSGVQTTPPTFALGSDAARSNYVVTGATTPSNAVVNSGTATPFMGIGPSGAGITSKVLPGSPVYLAITSPGLGTGGYSCIARFVTNPIWGATGDVT